MESGQLRWGSINSITVIYLKSIINKTLHYGIQPAMDIYEQVRKWRVKIKNNGSLIMAAQYGSPIVTEC